MPTESEANPSRRRARRSGYLYGCSLLLLLVLGCVVFLLTQFRQTHEQATAKAASDASNLTWVLDAQLDTTLRHIQSNLLQIQSRAASEPNMSSWSAARSESWSQYLISLSNTFPEISSIWIFNSAGDSIASTHTKKITVADRAYFIYLRDHPKSGLFFSDLIQARSDGREAMVIALRINDAAGAFQGVVSVLVDFNSLQKIFATVVGNTNNTISLRRIGNDRILVSQPTITEAQRHYGYPEISHLLDTGVKLGHRNLVSPIDGRVRISAFRMLNDYPFYVIVGIDQNEALAAWQHEVINTSLAAVLMLICLGLVFRHLWSGEQQQQIMLEHTERSLREQQHQNLLLVVTEQRHRNLLETLQTGVVLHGPDSKILYSNRRAGELLGLTCVQMQGKEAVDSVWCFIDEYGAPAAVEDYPVIHVIATGESITDKTMGITRPGESLPIWLMISAVPELNETGGLKQIVVNFYDITERKLAREQLEHQREHLAELIAERTVDLSKALEVVRRTQDDLVRAEKLASLGSMVAGISHELNTPLGNALLAATTMEQMFAQTYEQINAGNLRRTALNDFLVSGKEMAALITRSSARAAEMVASFKQVAVDQTSEQRRAFNLDQVVSDNLAALLPKFQKNHIQVQNLVAGEIACNSYPGPLGQVLTNLIQNAIIHGFIDRDEGTITISAIRHMGGLTVTIEDNGVGMTPDVLAHIFDPFFTTRLGQGGSGLGLSISHRIATSILGGDLKAESVLQRGSVFTLTFPEIAPFQL